MYFLPHHVFTSQSRMKALTRRCNNFVSSAFHMFPIYAAVNGKADFHQCRTINQGNSEVRCAPDKIDESN